MSPQWPRLPVIHVCGTDNDAPGRGRLQLPEQRRHLYEHRIAALQVHHADHCLRLSLLLHDHQRMVLLDGNRPVGHLRLRHAPGLRLHQVCPVRVDCEWRDGIRRHRIQADRYHAHGRSRERRCRRQPFRTYGCAGVPEFRPVLCVQPDPRARDANRRRPGILELRRHEPIARGLPHALGEQQRHGWISQRQGFRLRERGDLVHQVLRGVPEQWHAVAGCDVPDRAVFFERELRSARRHRPARSEHRQVPVELPPAVDRRLLERRALVRKRRRHGPDGSCAAAARRGPHNRLAVSASLL